MGVGRGPWRTKAPLDFKIWHFPITFLAKEVDFFNFELVKWNFTTFGASGKIFLATPWKNPSDAHIAATGTITRFHGSNIQLYYDNLHQGWTNIFYRAPHWKVNCYLGPQILHLSASAANLRFKIWINDITIHRLVQNFFFSGGKAEILLMLFRVLTMQYKWTCTKRFTLSTPLVCAIWTSALNLLSEICSTLQSEMLFLFKNCPVFIFSSTFYE